MRMRIRDMTGRLGDLDYFSKNIKIGAFCGLYLAPRGMGCLHCVSEIGNIRYGVRRDEFT
jgi:hypothetical protein